MKLVLLERFMSEPSSGIIQKREAQEYSDELTALSNERISIMDHFLSSLGYTHNLRSPLYAAALDPQKAPTSSILLLNKFMNPLCKLWGHTTRVYALTQLSNGDLLSGGRNIKMWRIKGTLPNIAGTKSSLAQCFCELKEGFVAVGYLDFTIRVWNIEERRCIRTLIAHSGSVTDLCISQEFLVSAGADGNIFLWGRGGELRESTPFRHHSVRKLLTLGEHFLITASFGENSCMKMWDMRTFTLLACRETHQFMKEMEELSSILLLRSGILVTGSHYGLLDSWNIRQLTFKQFAIIYFQQAIIHLMEPIRGVLTTIYHDMTFRIFDLKRKRCVYNNKMGFEIGNIILLNSNHVQ